MTTRAPSVAIGHQSRGRPGTPPDADALSLRLQMVLDRAVTTLDDETLRPPADATLADLEGAVTPALAALAACLRQPGDVARDHLLTMCGLLVELQAFQDDARERRMERRMAALASVQEGVARMRALTSVADMLDRAPVEACRSCGFDRAILFRVEGSELSVDAVHIEGDDAWAKEILRAGREHRPQLTHLLLETEMLRRRAPGLVEDPQNDPRTYKPLVEATETRSYVAAPIIPDERVIGFLHADCHFSGRPLDTIDRDILWEFAQGFGYAVERTMLRSRLASQREQVRRMVASVDVVLTELAREEVDLARHDGSGAAGDGMAQTAAGVFFAPESRIEALLTRREREVLQLMAGGATNGAIAERLVISEGTVKSHVKHILRKLRAANRAEAVSRYLRLASVPPDNGG